MHESLFIVNPPVGRMVRFIIGTDLFRGILVPRYERIQVQECLHIFDFFPDRIYLFLCVRHDLCLSNHYMIGCSFLLDETGN